MTGRDPQQSASHSASHSASQSTAPADKPRGRPLTWAQHRAIEAVERRQPDALNALADRLAAVGRANGLAAVGITTAEPLLQARASIEQRVASGHQADMVFTFTRPEKATTPARLIPDAAAVVVGAWPYYFSSPEETASASGNIGYRGDIARYQWVDHYGDLRRALGVLAAELKANGWRARVLADDNALVDRAAAHRAGIGWFGKNANLLLPGHGSWFVLGSVITNAPLPPAQEPVADGCGTCNRCIPACPTNAIVAPGVIDARRCLAWLVQAPGDIPVEYRVAMGARIYGCDDCQDVCPENRGAVRRSETQLAPPSAVVTADLVEIVCSTDDELLAKFGRWWLPNRNPDVLRRNAVVGLGNIGDPSDGALIAVLQRCEAELAPLGGAPDSDAHITPMVARHAKWAIHRLKEREVPQAPSHLA